jgi:peptidoglycan/xylan/chitin deacetylase (PgdA/CDA1 family)
VRERRPDPWNYGIFVDAAEFRRELQWLMQHFEPITLAGLRAWINGEWKHRKAPMMVTFDDGYENNAKIAAPILQEEGCPALFFLITVYVGTERMLWTDEVRVRVMDWPGRSIRLPDGGEAPVPPVRGDRYMLSRRIKNDCKQLPDGGRATYLEYLRAETPGRIAVDDPEARRFMTWDDARGLVKQGFDIGSHTVEHPILSRLTREAIAHELRKSKQSIEHELGHPCTSVAYPNGLARDVNETVVDEARAAGYLFGFMGTAVWQNRRGDMRQIARVGVPGHADATAFEFCASGMHSLLSRWRA